MKNSLPYCFWWVTPQQKKIYGVAILRWKKIPKTGDFTGQRQKTGETPFKPSSLINSYNRYAISSPF
jgi:hypothetical protein